MARTTSSAFDTEVATNQIRPVELLDIFLGDQDNKDASTLHYAIHTETVSYFDTDNSAQDYTPIAVKRSSASNSMDLEQRQVTFEIDNLDKAFQTFFFQNADFMRDKRIVLRTILLDAASTSSDAVKIIDGTIDTVTITERFCQIELHGAIGQLRFKTGRRMDRICPYAFGDTECARGRTLTTLTQPITDTLTGSSTKTSLVFSTVNVATNYYKIGKITFNSGTNNGYVRKVIAWDSATKTATLDFGLPNTPGAGDSVTIVRDCDKTFDSCHDRFTEVDATDGNSANFGGFHTIVQSINP